jgi:hypothetical protein
MATKRTLVGRCRALGVRLTDDGDVLRLDCPPGKVLAGSGLHWRDLDLWGWTRPAAYDELMADLAMGVEDCEREDCEACKSAD